MAKDIAQAGPDLLAEAIKANVAPESLERLIDMQIKVRAEQARAAFAADYVALQGDLSTVIHNRDGHVGNRYADIATIEAAIREPCCQHGFSHSFTIRKIGDVDHVVCIVRHRHGHIEECGQFPIEIDKRENRKISDAQKIAIGVTFAKRYALCMSFGITTADMIDDDGAAPPETITEQTAADLAAMCDEVGADVDRFLKWAGVASFGEILERDKDRIVRALEAKRGKA